MNRLLTTLLSIATGVTGLMSLQANGAGENQNPPAVEVALKQLELFRQKYGVLQQPLPPTERNALVYAAHYPHTTATKAKDPILQGQTDYPLAPGGEEEAYQMGEKIARDAQKEGRIISLVLTADSVRAKQTAQAIAAAIQKESGGKKVEVVATADLRGENHGTWEGKSESWINTQEHRKEWNNWTDAQRFFIPYGVGDKAESKATVLARMLPRIHLASRELLSKKSEKLPAFVLVVSGAFFKGMSVLTHKNSQELDSKTRVGHGGLHKYEDSGVSIAPCGNSKN